MRIKLRLLLSVLAGLLGAALAVSVFLPWFHIPILGLEIPAPAWSRAGVACIVTAALLFLRAIAGNPLRWLVRLALLPTAYFWWHSLEQMQAWGAKSLAPAQLKLSTVNLTLTKLGGEQVTIYEPAAWRSLEPSFGWKVAGGILVVTALFTILDGPRIRKCPACGKKGADGDSFCFHCGKALTHRTVCSNCGQTALKGDAHCRNCSRPLSPD